MIDKRELMIGDWVQLDDFYNEPIIMQVGGIYQNTIRNIIPWADTKKGTSRTDIENGIKLDEALIDEIIPIPLTDKILEKNGFEKVNSQSYDLRAPNGDYNIIVNPKSKRIHINFDKGNCKLYPDVLNVHTLQHALRLCGLGNLADNFQV